MLAAKAEAFSAFKQKWTLKLAKALANSFNDATSAYRKRTNLEHFWSVGSDRRQGCTLCSVAFVRVHMHLLWSQIEPAQMAKYMGRPNTGGKIALEGLYHWQVVMCGNVYD